MKTRLKEYRVIEKEFNSFSANFLREKLEVLSKEKKKVTIALSGGTTPLPILEIMKDYNLNWENFVFFMVDERNVSIHDFSSNYGNIKKTFFDNVNSESHSMMHENYSVDDCVIEYEKLLWDEVPSRKNDFPSIDLMLLGMGDDGHTASLFPNTEGLKENAKCVVKNWVPQLNTFRVTLTYPVLTNANEVILLIKGENKKKIYNELSLEVGSNYPIYKVINSGVNVTCIIGSN